MLSIFTKEKRIADIVRLSRLAFGRYKQQILVLAILGFLSGILEGIGINALMPIFSFATGDDYGATDKISQIIKNIFLYFNFNFNIKYLLIFVSTLFIFKALISIFFNYIRVKIFTDYEERTRNALLSATLSAQWSYLLKQKLGYLENVLMTDVRSSSSLLDSISSLIIGTTGLFIYILVAINISLYITLLTLTLGAVLFLIFKPLMHKTRLVSRQTSSLNKNVSHYVNEKIIGMKVIKSINAGGKILEISKIYFQEFKRLKIKTYIFKTLSATLLQPISLIFVCLVFAFYYRLPNFNFAALVVIIYLIQKIFIYIQDLQSTLHKINEDLPYLSNILKYKQEALSNKEAYLGKDHFKFINNLEFKNVDFAYNLEKNILTKINFNIIKGEMVGLIGPSGAGKTTLADLILRLFALKSGEILLDNKNISEININEWRKNIGYVSQDIFLLNDTIANNIRFYDKSITNLEIEKATKMANIYDFIQKTPAKFATIIGERGIRISAGQRQRIIIARILIRQPQFLIFDEATSSLDNESELKIQKVIENLKGKVTVLMIAHRLSTIINCDKLIVLENGKITKQGIPSELLNDKNSYFYKMYNIRK